MLARGEPASCSCCRRDPGQRPGSDTPGAAQKKGGHIAGSCLRPCFWRPPCTAPPRDLDHVTLCCPPSGDPGHRERKCFCATSLMTMQSSATLTSLPMLPPLSSATLAPWCIPDRARDVLLGDSDPVCSCPSTRTCSDSE